METGRHRAQTQARVSWVRSVEGKARPLTLLPNCLTQCHLFSGGNLPGPRAGFLGTPALSLLQDEADLSASQLAWLGAGDHAYYLQVQLEHPRPIEADLEGEETAVWEDDLQGLQRLGSLKGSGVFPGFDRDRGSQLLE